MDLENEVIKILEIRKKMNVDFEISKNSEKLDGFLDSYFDDDEKKLKEIEKLRYSNPENGIREYYLNEFLKEDIFKFRDSLIKYPGSFNEFKEIVENSNQLESGKIILAPFFKTSSENDFGFSINTNIIEQLSYDEIEERIRKVPENLVGIVNSKIIYNGNYKFQYGTPIIYEKY